MRNTASLPLLPGQLWPRMVAYDRVQSMGQIEQTMCKQMTDCDYHMAKVETVQLCAKKTTSSFKNVIYKMCLQIIYIYIYSITKPNFTYMSSGAV